MFVGRKYELDTLNEMYHSTKFEMVVLHGRRKVGKTTLVNEFIKDKEKIYFSPIEMDSNENLHLLSQSINKYAPYGHSGEKKYSSFSAALKKIGELGEEKRLIFVIDDYPALVKSESSIGAMLRKQIDYEYRFSKLFIIICGNNGNFMEKHALGYQSPLYGRRTAQLRLAPMDYLATGEMLSGFDYETKAQVYGITGGVPFYTEQFNTSMSLKDNLLELLFRKNAPFYNEPSDVLRQEFRDLHVYNSILRTISNGTYRMCDIKERLSFGKNSAATYLSNLVRFGIVSKSQPITERKSHTKTMYRIEDMLFRFWYRFVPQNGESIATGEIYNVYHDTVQAFLFDYMGDVFKRMCRDYLLNYVELPFEMRDCDGWWDIHPHTNKEEKIDIVITSYDRNSVLLGECRYGNGLVRKTVLDMLKKKASAFEQSEIKYYYIFSKNGFTKELLKEEGEFLKLITLEDLYS